MRNPFKRRSRRVGSEEAPEAQTPSKTQAKALSPDGLRIVEFPNAYTQAVRLYNVGGNYAAIYASQPNVRTAIEIVAREAAVLSLKMYFKDDRGKDKPTARIEIDHPMMDLLNEPVPGESLYRFWFHLFADIEIYDRAFWWKIRDGGSVKALYRIPPANLQPIRDPLTYVVLYYQAPNGQRILPKDLVTFHGYDPAMNHGAIAPMETVRRIIADDIAAGMDREGRWRNSARKDGVIESHIDAKPMQDAAKESFLVDVEDSLAGPTGSGRPLVLLPGQTMKDHQWSPRELEYLNARKLNRLEIASHFHIPPAMMAAAGNNAEADEETLKFFYKSSLPPRLQRVEMEIEAQLLPEFELTSKARSKYYVSFNMDEKLRADFEKRAEIMATTVGGPVVSVNEGRARLDLPPTDEPLDDKIYAPTNSIRGGGPQASPQNPVQTPAAGNEPVGTTPGGGTNPEKAMSIEDMLAKADAATERRAAFDEQATFLKETRIRYEERAANVFRRTFERQKRATGEFQMDRWNKELTDDLFGLLYQAADVVGTKVAADLDVDWDSPRTANLIKARAEAIAEAVNQETAMRLKNEEDAFADERAGIMGMRAATWICGWTPMEVAHQNEALPDGMH